MRENNAGHTVNEQETERISNLFQQGLAKLGIEIPGQSTAALVKYAQELIKWNRRVNLIAKNTSLQDVVEKHFLDSLTLLPVLEDYMEDQAFLLDVGSGAGFPGLVIKAVCPNRPVILLEPRQRRVSFLNHIVRVLNLTDIHVIPERTDDFDSFSHPSFAVITGRAVADVTAFLGMVQALAIPGTLVVCMQGLSGKKQWECERDNQHFSRVAIEHIHLPFSRADRYILLFRKE